MFKEIKVKSQLLIILGFAVLNVALVGGIAIFYLNSVVTSYGHLAEVNMPALRAVNDARNAQRDIIILVSTIAASERAVADADKSVAEFDRAVKAYDAATTLYSALPAQPGEIEIREKVKDAWKDFSATSKEIVDRAGAQDAKEIAERARIATHQLSDARKVFRENFKALTEYHDLKAKEWGESAQQAATLSKKIIVGTTMVGGILVLLAGLQIASALARKLTLISEKILAGTVASTESTQTVSAASEQLAASSTQQASSIQETAAAMEEISAMVEKNTATAQSARAIALESQQKAVDGKQAVLSMVESIQQISKSNLNIGVQISASNQEMTEITKVIAEIESKTKVINDIVFQTKLLSFNASVEAARAGEHGKGFAVVAEEVGNLAQMSGTASQSITEILLIGTKRVQDIIDRSTAQVGHLLTDNKGKISHGVETAESCRKILEELVDNVSQVAEMASSIAVASEEQSHGVREANSAVTQFSTVVNETNASSHSLSTASHSLVEQNDAMTSVVEQLAIVVNGRSKN